VRKEIIIPGFQISVLPSSRIQDNRIIKRIKDMDPDHYSTDIREEETEE